MKKIYKTLCIFILFFVVSTNLKSQCTFKSSIPYFQDFSTITIANPLPQCWTTIGNAATSPYLTTKYAFFSTSQLGGSYYFFTNGLQLSAGVVYSVSVFYMTDLFLNTNWSNFSVLLGTSQTTTGLVSIVSTTGSAVSPLFAPISNTFVVYTSGIYYAAINATSIGSGSPYLCWDDFTIEIPCQLNTPPYMLLYTSSTVFCEGQTTTLIANGLNNYSWNNNNNNSIITGSAVVVSPTASCTYSVTGNYALTNCNTIKSIFIQVNPNPTVSIVPSATSVCFGSSVTLYAIGANTFSWSYGTNGNFINVAPLVTSTYVVTGFDQNGCFRTASKVIMVNQLPSINVVASGTLICDNGLPVNLKASGANSYIWQTTSTSFTGSVINPTLKLPTTFTVVGKDVNGCINDAKINISVVKCLGTDKVKEVSLITLFPNPVQNYMVLEGLNLNSSIELFDLNNRLILASKVNEEKTTIDLSRFTKGIYFLKIKSDNEIIVKKIIKE